MTYIKYHSNIIRRKHTNSFRNTNKYVVLVCKKAVLKKNSFCYLQLSKEIQNTALCYELLKLRLSIVASHSCTF